jgi:hypothetical protein
MTRKKMREWLAPVVAAAGVGIMVLAGAAFLFIPACERENSVKNGPGLLPDQKMTLYYYDPSAGKYQERSLLVPKASVQDQLKTLVEGLAEKTKDRPGLALALPVRNVFLRKNGLLLLDFEKTVKYNHNDALEELAAMRSLLQTVTANFKNIRAVKFLVGGQEDETLAGHMNISRPLGLDDLTW